MTTSLTFSGFAAQLREFISHHSATPSLASPANRENEFNQLALSLFALQFSHNQSYRRFCESRQASPETVEHWSQIPAMPAVAFKELELTSLPADRRVRVFHSSGTTEQRPGRHFHDAESLSLYEASLLPWFQKHLLPEFSSITSRSVAAPEGLRTPHFLSLTPPPELAPHSSLVHMFATIHREFSAPDSIFTGLIQSDAAWYIDFAKSLAALREAVVANRPIVVMGTAFNFVQLCDHLEQSNLRVSLPAGSRVLETGGYKGRSRSLPKPELHALIARLLDIPPSRIVSEYGMSELSSQAYDLKLSSGSKIHSSESLTHPTPQTARDFSSPSPPHTCGGEGRGEEVLCSSEVREVSNRERGFRFPPWARVQIISPETGREVADGGTGLIRVFDLANLRSVLAVQTEDLGIRRGDGFELLGRAALAEARGCSLMSA
jgi:hypothetical protein